MRLLVWSFVAALTAGWLFAATAGHAQTSSPSPGASGQAANITDQKLDATANAIQKVTVIKQDYQQKLQAAPASDRDRIADEASDAMVKAVSAEGLSVEEYNSIIEVAQNDPAVHQKIVQRLQSKQ